MEPHNDLLGRILQSPRLPSLPTIALKVIDLAQQPEVEFRHIAEAIQHDPGLWVANYYSARNPLRLSSLVILGVVARMFRCATRSSCWCT